MNGLHYSILLELSRSMDAKSCACLASASKMYYEEMQKIAKKKKRIHCLRMALIRLRFINMYIDDEEKMIKEFITITHSCFFRMSSPRLYMTCSMRIFSYFEYNGPPDYLYNFAPDQYDILGNMVLNYEDNMFKYISNVYAMTRQTPLYVLEDFMFNFENIELY